MPDREEIAEKLAEAASVLEAVRDEYNNDEYYNELIRAVDAVIGIVRARQITSPTQESVEPFHMCTYGARTLISNKLYTFCPYCGRRIKRNGDC